jgi:hypothetical protein
METRQYNGDQTIQWRNENGKEGKQGYTNQHKNKTNKQTKTTHTSVDFFQDTKFLKQAVYIM